MLSYERVGSLALALSSLGALVSAQQDVITDDTYFYGQSEPVYPSPDVSASGPWEDAVSKAKAFVSQLTLEEKVNLTGGVETTTTCSGLIPAVPRLGFPGLCLANNGNNIQATDYVSAFPSGLHVGASWNRNLTRQKAVALGNEAKIKGVNALLGPVAGPLGRVVSGGRNWEGFAVDPYLSGQLTAETVLGMQEAGVVATTKHFIAQEQETHRIPTIQPPHVDAVSSNLDDRTMHELYLWPFQDAVKAGTGSIMCSYQRLNNSYGCANSKSLNGLLKTELGFQGFVMSDWTAQTSGVGTALAGLDMAMPTGEGFWAGNLTIAVNNGSVPESRVDDMVTRIMASWYQMNQNDDFPEPGFGMPADLTAPHKVVDARDRAAKSILLDGAIEGHVLVKNDNNALPLSSENMKLISLFGYSAKAPNHNNPTVAAEGQMFAPWEIGAESGNADELNAGFLGNLNLTYSAIAPNGTLISGGGSGTSAQNLISAPYDALVSQCQEDDTALFWDFESGDPAVNPTSDACIVFGNVWATEGYDRPNLRDTYTDDLINNVAAKCSNTMVVLHNAGARVLDGFIEHPNVTAVILAHLPGQESGRALVSLLYGRANPSGRLPYTVARNESDYGHMAFADLTLAPNRFERFPQSNFSEGTLVDYRHFDAYDISPRFEFGFGLSYTTFEYGGLEASKVAEAATQPLPTGAVAEGGQTDLWDEIAEVTAEVSNSGSVDGKDVAQLYVKMPGDGANGAAVRQLRGFEKVNVGTGETATVRFALTRRDLSIWDVQTQKWKLQAGSYDVFVGRSSRDLPLAGTLVI